MNYLKNFLENNILPTNLEDLKNEIREKIKLVENEITLNVQTEKVTKFEKTVTQKQQKVNLKKFFKTNIKFLDDNSDFQKFLKDALSDCDEASEKYMIYRWHTTTEISNDGVIWPEIGQEIIDMNTAEGRLEARDRLNYLRTEIEYQSEGQSGALLNNGNTNVIGIFKLKSNYMLTVGARWNSGRCRWNYCGRFLFLWGVGNQFLSSNQVD